MEPLGYLLIHAQLALPSMQTAVDNHRWFAKEMLMNTPGLTEEMKACIKMCLDCHAACTQVASHMLHGGSGHSEAAHLVALLDCAQACLAHADFMARRSPHHAALAGICAELCNACASMCEQHAAQDAEMQQCAQTCRQCAGSCQKMATAPAMQAGTTAAPQGTGAQTVPTSSAGQSGGPSQGKGAGATQFL